MNTKDFPDSDLSRHLARKADEFDRIGGSPLELGQVLDRAGEIRRGRRMRATMAMAAAVLAVAVPTALVTMGNDHAKTPVTPAKQVKVDRSPLSLDGLKQGEAPRLGHVEGNSWHANGSTVELTPTGSVRAVVPLDDDAYLVETDLGEGNLRATVVPTPPEFVGQETSWPVEGGLALSSGGNVAAFVQPDGTPVVVQDGGRTSYELPKIPRGSGFRAAAVVGEECRPQAEDSGCAVWVTSHGEQPETWVVTADRVARSDLSIRSVLAVKDELVAGITEVKDDLTTCSEVLRFDGGTPLWQVCGHQPVAFSPDGTQLLGFADSDALGTTGLAVYDSETGDALLELGTGREAVIPQAVWEDDSHLLATVFEKGRWAIIRIGLDGSREYAVAPVEGGDESPFVLPTR